MLRRVFLFPATGQDTPSGSELLRCAVPTTFCTLIVIAALSGLSVLICTFYPSLKPNFDYVSRYPLAVSLLCFALLPAICEELVFRRLILRFLQRRFSDFAAVLLSSLLFAVFHFGILQSVIAFIFGIFLAAVAIRTRSVILCIYAHLLNNALFLCIAYKCHPPSTGIMLPVT